MRLAVVAFALALASASAVSVAQAAPPPIEAYGQLPAIEQVSLSPSGARMAFIATDADGVRKVFVRTVDGKPLAVAPLGGAKIREVDWAGEDNVIVFWTVTVNLGMFYDFKNELQAALNINLVDHTAKPLLANAKIRTPIIFGYYGTGTVKDRLKGYFLVYGSGLVEVDLQSGENRTRVAGTDFSDEWVVDGQGQVISRTEFDSRNGDWRLFAGDFGGHALDTRRTPLYEIALAGMGRTPGTVMVADDTGPALRYLEYGLDGPGKGVELFAGEPVSHLLIDPQTRLLIGAQRRDGSAVLFDPVMQKKFDGARKAFPGKQVWVVSYSNNLDRMVLQVDGDDDSGDYWLVDIPKHSAAPLGDRYPAVKPADVGPTRMFSYKAADGLALEGVLTLPPGREAKGLPLIVLPHGGPITAGDRVAFDWWAQAFAAQGYAVIQPNYRGTEGYGRAFRNAGYGEWGRKMQTDLSDGVAALAAQGIIDPKRVCIVGGSYGGYAALAGVTLQHGIYRCAVSVAGVSNLPALLLRARERQGSQSPEVRFWRSVTGASATGEGALKALSPDQLADQADAPILLIHGKDDTVVPYDQSQSMLKALNKAGKPVEMVTLDGEDHWLSKGETRTAMLRAAVAFVVKNNPPN